MKTISTKPCSEFIKEILTMKIVKYLKWKANTEHFPLNDQNQILSSDFEWKVKILNHTNFASNMKSLQDFSEMIAEGTERCCVKH